MNEVKRVCYSCSSDGELRPYGPNGSWVCFTCAMKPENIKETESQFTSQLQASGPVVIIGEETGPRPLRTGLV